MPEETTQGCLWLSQIPLFHVDLQAPISAGQPWPGVIGKARASSPGVSCLRTERSELNRGLGASWIWGQATLRFWREEAKGGNSRRPRPMGQRFFPTPVSRTRKCS